MFAEKVENERAIVIAPKAQSDDPNVSNGLVRGCSVWNRIEYATLWANSNVKYLDWVDADNLDGEPQTVFNKNEDDPRPLETTDEGGACID